MQATKSRGSLERLRQTLNRTAGERAGRGLLFEALTVWGPRVPSDASEVLAFVRGPFRRTLFKRLDPAEALELMLEAETALAVVDPTQEANPSPLPSSQPPPSSASATWAFPQIPERAVEVLVLSATTELAYVLAEALGPDLIACRTESVVYGVAQLFGEATDLVLVDGMAPPRVDPVALARVLAHRPAEGSSTQVGPAIWGSEGAFGTDLRLALEATGVPTIPFASDEGILPFVDLVRSQRA